MKTGYHDHKMYLIKFKKKKKYEKGFSIFPGAQCLVIWIQ